MYSKQITRQSVLYVNLAYCATLWQFVVLDCCRLWALDKNQGHLLEGGLDSVV
jgi:hypothetical protein